MNSLAAKSAAGLVAVFLLAVAAILFAVESSPVRALSFEVALGIVAAALVGAWLLTRPASRRIERVVAALAVLEQGGFAPSLKLEGADATGDEVARLASHIERLAKHMAEQQARLAESATRRREFLANVSHDLRTPLASMQGYLELLLLRHGDLEAAEAHNYLQTAARQSERLSRLVDDLFELTRLEAEDMRAEEEPFAPAELAQDVTQKYAGDARRREVTLSTRCGVAADSAGSTMVHADIGLIERVLDNLVDNALRHTPAGGAVTIEIEHDASRAHLAVCDTGAGIAADELPGLFERYDRAARVGGDSGAHAGLGLAIAQRIVRLHGSRLSVCSAPGKGTRVSFDLALAQRRVPRT